MKPIVCENIKETVYTEKLANGLTLFVIPRNNTSKKYMIWGTHFGSIDNHFFMPGSEEEVYIPDGVAHFLEHKMFEQPDGTNSLDTLMALGVDANAYTTNDHTAYLFECTDHFEEAFAELMNYVQHPYFTDQNVEKEKGIIGQEIRMYDDEPGWKLYINAMECLYAQNPIRIDIAGTVESISEITPDILYKCYHTFYHPSNTVMVLCGDFDPEEILKKVEKNLLSKEAQGEIERIYPPKEEKIHQKEKVEKLEVSIPLYMIGILDTNQKENSKSLACEHMAIEILLNIIIGKSSELYKTLYERGSLLAQPDFDYEFSKQYAHILIGGQSLNPRDIYESFKKEVERLKQEGISKEDFERAKKKVYGSYVVDYNNIDQIARMFLADTMKGVFSFDYINNYEEVSKDFAEQVLHDKFQEKNMILSLIEKKSEN